MRENLTGDAAIHRIVVPDLDLADEPLRVGAWLVRRGEIVLPGQPLVEVVAPAAVVDVVSPVYGKVTQRLVAEDQPVRVGQVLAVVCQLPRHQ